MHIAGREYLCSLYMCAYGIQTLQALHGPRANSYVRMYARLEWSGGKGKIKVEYFRKVETENLIK